MGDLSKPLLRSQWLSLLSPCLVQCSSTMDTHLVLQTLASGMEPGRPESRPSSDVLPGALLLRHWECVFVWEFLGQNLRSAWAWWAPWFQRTQHPSTETKLLVFISEERHYLPAACWTEIGTMGHKSFSRSLEYEVIWWKPCIAWSHLCHGKCGH